MHYIASTTLPELATVLGVVFGGFTGLLVGFYKYAQWQQKEATKERSQERKDFTAALQDVAESNRLIAKETKQGNKEAKERNGHLAELTIEHGVKMLEAIQNIKSQHVESQTVDHLTVENKE